MEDSDINESSILNEKLMVHIAGLHRKLREEPFMMLDVKKLYIGMNLDSSPNI